MIFTIGAEYNFRIGEGTSRNGFVGEIVATRGTLLVARARNGQAHLIDMSAAEFDRASVIGPLPKLHPIDRMSKDEG